MKHLILWINWALFESWMQGRWIVEMRNVGFISLFRPEKKPPRQSEPGAPEHE